MIVGNLDQFTYCRKAPQLFQGRLRAFTVVDTIRKVSHNAQHVDLEE